MIFGAVWLVFVAIVASRLSRDDVVVPEPPACPCRLHESNPNPSCRSLTLSGKRRSEPCEADFRPSGRHRVPARAGARLALVVAGPGGHAARALRLLFLIWAWWLTARYESTFSARDRASDLPVRGGPRSLDHHRRAGPGGAGRLAGRRARARHSPASLDHHRQPSRDRRGPLARQALPGRHGHPGRHSGRWRSSPRSTGWASRTCWRWRCCWPRSGFGAGGLAVGASVVSRRGRDAQLTVYILMILLMMSPLLGWLGLPHAGRRGARMVQPLFQHEPPGLGRRCAQGARDRGVLDAVWALPESGWRSGGSARAACPSGVTLAKTRQAQESACRSASGRCSGKSSTSSVSPAWADSAAGSAFLLTLAIGGGSFVLAGMMAYAATFRPIPRWSPGLLDILSVVLGGFAGTLLGWLLQWGVGLRAAVSIASERERAHLGRPLDEPAQPERNRRGQARSAAFMRCATWPPPCCWPGRWRSCVGAVSVRIVYHLDRRELSRWLPSWPPSACAVRFRCRRPRAP